MINTILLFIVGLVFLIKGGDWFVDGATGLSRKFHINELIIGATVVSIGTTLPEVMVSAQSALIGHGEIAYGNAIGSIICNTALISAITLAIHPTSIKKKSLLIPVLFFFVALLIYSFVSYTNGYFSQTVGIIFLIIFVLYIIYNIYAVKRGESEIEVEPETKTNPLWLDLALIVIGAVIIAIGANLLIDNGTILARYLGVPESVIALTLIAFGTSLPELATAITALVKGHENLSLGNIIGANLFNIVLVTGVSATLSPFSVPSSKLLFENSTALLIDIPTIFLVMTLLVLPPIIKGKTYKWQGYILLFIYIIFCFIQFFIN